MIRLGSETVLAVIVAVSVASGVRAYDLSTDAEWEVSPKQIAQAKLTGRLGVESRPGTVTVLPIRSELADFLPFKWTFFGLVAGYLVFTTRYMVTRNRSDQDSTQRSRSNVPDAAAPFLSKGLAP